MRSKHVVEGSTPPEGTTSPPKAVRCKLYEFKNRLHNAEREKFTSSVARRRVAQLVAHLVWDQGVAGSSPASPTSLTVQASMPRWRNW